MVKLLCTWLLDFMASFIVDITGEETTCSLNAYLLVDDVQEEKEEVIETIRNLLPFDLPTPTSSSPDTSNQVYEQLAELFEESPSTEGRDKFTAAVDEIFTAYNTECSESSIPGTESITSLVTKFNELTTGLNSIRKEDLSQARGIYGKFLCLQETSGGGRRKRQSGISMDEEDYESPSECECPSSGVTEACHFFACLKVSVVQFIMGFGNSKDDLPCIGFIVDTTGSMGNEIAAARRIILQFIKSQADSTYCYLLVPFNDYDHIDPSKPGK